MVSNSMSVLVIDDHALFSAGIKGLYEAMNDDVVVNTFVSCDEAFGGVEDMDAVSLVLLDYHIPGTDPERNLKVLRSTFTNASIVIVSGETDPLKVIRAINQGASGFIPKAATSETMISALKIISAGGVYLPPEVNSYYSTGPEATPNSTEHPLEGLHKVTREVVELAISGMSNQAIAEKRGTSLSTIKNQLSKAYKDLGVRNRAQLVLECGKYNQRANR